MPGGEPGTDRVVLRFYEELDDHLPPERRKVGSSLEVVPGTTVGELLVRFQLGELRLSPRCPE